MNDLRRSEQPVTQTWTYQPIFTKKQVDAITKKASLFTKFKLLFCRSHYTFDSGVMYRYKRIGDTIYILKEYK